MRDLKPWEAEGEEEHRIASAFSFIKELDEFSGQAIWGLIVEAIGEEMMFRMQQLELSNRDDERHRGALEVLRWVRDLPRSSSIAAQSAIANRGDT